MIRPLIARVGKPLVRSSASVEPHQRGAGRAHCVTGRSWEIAIKAELGRLMVPEDLTVRIERADLRTCR